MYVFIYEFAASITSLIIFVVPIYIFILKNTISILLISLSGLLSLITRLYRIYKKEYVMDSIIVYLDIIFAILAFIIYLIYPFGCYEIVLSAFCLMIIAAIMSWNIFNINLIVESFILQMIGHLLVAFSLIDYTQTILYNNTLSKY